MTELGDLSQVIADMEDDKTTPEEVVVQILMRIMEELYNESNVLVLQAPLVICGDIHGQLDDLMELLTRGEWATMLIAAIIP
jgi:alpha-D-ribose 1-methylphosphonate 5-phosphate C-P lyase